MEKITPIVTKTKEKVKTHPCYEARIAEENVYFEIQLDRPHLQHEEFLLL